MTVHPVRWLASTGLDLAWHVGASLDGWLEDVDGAIAAGDMATAFQAAAATRNGIAIAWLCLEGAPLASSEIEMWAMLGHARSEAIIAFASWPAIAEIDVEGMTAIRTSLGTDLALLRAELPFDLPKLREPDGLMPTLRVVREVDRLRARYGLPAFDWPGLLA